MDSYRDLIVWQKSIMLVEQVNLALSLCNEVSKMLGAIIRKLGNTRNSNPYPPTPYPLTPIP